MLNLLFTKPLLLMYSLSACPEYSWCSNDVAQLSLHDPSRCNIIVEQRLALSIRNTSQTSVIHGLRLSYRRFVWNNLYNILLLYSTKMSPCFTQTHTMCRTVTTKDWTIPICRNSCKRQSVLLLTSINTSFMREYKIFYLLAKEFIPHKTKSHCTCMGDVAVLQW
jgi:hypothetical protein